MEVASKSPRLEGIEDLMRGSPMNSRICQTDAASPAEPTDLLNGLASIGHLCLVSLTIFHDGDYPTMDIQEGSRTGAPFEALVWSRRGAGGNGIGRGSRRERARPLLCQVLEDGPATPGLQGHRRLNPG